jgi:hypothetical protein
MAAHLSVAADDNLDLAGVEHAAFDRAAEGALLPGNGVVGVLLLDAVLHLRVEPVPAVVLADPGAVRAVRQPLPADIVGGLADVLPADDDVGRCGRSSPW